VAIAVVVLALAGGLAVWAPWKSPPLLKPTGLTAGASTISSVAFHWANPASGPPPDKYLVLRGGKVIGSVPGSVTSYHTTGLAPDTAYVYRVAAERGGKRSALSAALVVHTAIPPISAARWQGLSTVAIKIIKGRATIQGTKKWTETWVATPKCTSGPCTVRLAAAMNGHRFKVTMARAGAVYRGTAHSNVFPCGKGSTAFPIRSTLRIRVKLKTAQVTNGAWTASDWSGTMTVVSPYTSSGNYYCPASTQTASLSGAP
jgi:fibronectin type III domain protein